MMYNCHARWMEHSTNLEQKLQYNIGFYLCCTIYKSCDVSSKLSDKREIVFFQASSGMVNYQTYQAVLQRVASKGEVNKVGSTGVLGTFMVPKTQTCYGKIRLFSLNSVSTA